MQAKFLKQDPRLWTALTALLLLVLSAVMIWERTELARAMAAGHIEALLAHPGRLMSASFIITSGIIMLSFGTLYLCNMAISTSPLNEADDIQSDGTGPSCSSRHEPTTLALAAEEYRIAEAAKDRALELAIVRERERIMELLRSGAKSFDADTLGFSMTKTYAEFRELEADLVAGLYRMRAGHAADLLPVA